MKTNPETNAESEPKLSARDSIALNFLESIHLEELVPDAADVLLDDEERAALEGALRRLGVDASEASEAVAAVSRPRPATDDSPSQHIPNWMRLTEWLFPAPLDTVPAMSTSRPFARSIGSRPLRDLYIEAGHGPMLDVEVTVNRPRLAAPAEASGREGTRSIVRVLMPEAHRFRQEPLVVGVRVPGERERFRPLHSGRPTVFDLEGDVREGLEVCVRAAATPAGLDS